MREALSDYTRLLFLRRRLGIKEPGELETLLEHPELAAGMIQKQAAIKRALSSGAVNTLKALGVLGATGGGYLAGSEGLSRVMGYHDDPVSKHVGGGISAGNALAIALLLATKGRKGTGKLLNKHPMLPASMLGMEAIPAGVVRPMRDISKATAGAAENQVSPTIARLLQTPGARGAGAGVGVAGLLGLTTGLTRARREDEMRKGRTRMGMVSSDTLKYLLPAMLGGGLVGSMALRK
jgi:hypothetical protein